MDDPGFWEWVKTPRSQGGGGLKSGDPIATEAAYNTLMREYLKSGGNSFQPTAVAVTNPVNTNQVVPMIMTSPGSAIPFPQPSFKEGKVDDQGTPLVFDDTTGMYFPATNKSTRAPVKPQANQQVQFVPGPNGTLIPMMPGLTPTNTPTPTPDPAAVAPARSGTFETNMLTPASAPMLSPQAMSPAQGMSMTPTAAPAPAAPAPAAPRVFTRAQYKQMTGQDLAPGQYENAKGQPFDIVP